MANKSKDPKKRKFPEDAEYTDTVLSVRVSGKLTARMDAAEEVLKMDRSELVRYAIVRLMLSVENVAQNQQSLPPKEMAMLLEKSGFSTLPISDEELLYALTYDGELSSRGVNDLRSRVEKLEALMRSERRK